MTALSFEVLVGLFVGQFLLAMAGVLVAYRLVEINWTVGLLGSLTLGVVTLTGEWYIGDVMWNPGLGARPLVWVVLVAVGGGVLGIMTAATMFRPEHTSESSTPESDDPARPQKSRDSTTTPDAPMGLGEE
jgi:cadmium resistance protein CadD (predicted permease)